MNPIIVIKFFYIIHNALFMSLLIPGKVKKELLESISNYFATIKTNECGIFYLHCLVWLKKAPHLATLHFQI